MTQDLKKAGQIVAFRFPQTDLEKGKLRPALLLAKLPNEYDDWLTCMIKVDKDLFKNNLNTFNL
jgi:mRNA interferase MazF